MLGTTVSLAMEDSEGSIAHTAPFAIEDGRTYFALTRMYHVTDLMAVADDCDAA